MILNTGTVLSIRGFLKNHFKTNKNKLLKQTGNGKLIVFDVHFGIDEELLLVIYYLKLFSDRDACGVNHLPCHKHKHSCTGSNFLSVHPSMFGSSDDDDECLYVWITQMFVMSVFNVKGGNNLGYRLSEGVSQKSPRTLGLEFK